MAPLNTRGDLAAAQIAFFAPAFCVALFVVFRHGFSKQLGWIYLNILSILRLIGASCLIYAEVNQDYSSGLITTAAITTAIGTAPLLLVLLGFLERVHIHMLEQRGISNLIFQAIHLASIAGLVLAIVGGVDLSSANSPTDSDATTGKALLEAASIIFMAMYLTLAVITVITHARGNYVVPTERKLVCAGLVSLPFLFIRIIYTVFVSFQINKNFIFHHVDVWVEAFMQFLMEAIVVLVFIIAGLLTPRTEKPAPAQHFVEPGEAGTRYYEKNQTSIDSDSRPSSGGKRERNLMDYRPSRLIKNAIKKQVNKGAQRQG